MLNWFKMMNNGQGKGLRLYMNENADKGSVVLVTSKFRVWVA